MQLQFVFYNLGNHIVISNYNTSVLTMKVFFLLFFSQSATNQTTSQTGLCTDCLMSTVRIMTVRYVQTEDCHACLHEPPST